jgi:hypothetical protein
MKVLVTGGRHFTDREWLFSELTALDQQEPISQIIHGNALGADRLSGEWARISGVDCRVFDAPWAQYGKMAGHIRNSQMLQEAKPDLVLAFPGGKGTLDMVRQAIARQVSVRFAQCPSIAP